MNELNARKRIVQLVHDTSEPFLTLSGLYARAMRDAGYKVTSIFIVGEESAAVRNKAQADETIFVNASKQELRGLKLNLVAQLRPVLTAADVKLVIAQRYKPTYLALLATFGTDIPVIGVAHAFGVLDHFSRRLLLRVFRSRLTLVGVSQAVTNDMQQQAPTLRYATLLNAIDVRALQPRLRSRLAARAQLGLSNDWFVFGNVGRLHQDKDQPTLIRAFARIAAKFPEARLLLVGKGAREQEYQQLASELGIAGQVLIPGAVPEVATLYAAFDVYVSSSDREPFGIVLCEAMLAKLPVISTDCGGAPEVLGETAHYFKSGDDKALAALMEAALTCPESERRNRGEQLHARLQQQFTAQAFATRLLALIDSVAATHPV